MRIIRRESYSRMPWKNSQGMTEEIMVVPQDGGIDAFDWRLSIAHVGANGPFSLFPGVDRTIALLDGDGLLLDLPENRTVALTRGGPPFTFPGDWTISSRNIGGPTMDLNVMTRRGRFAHAMSHETIHGLRPLRAADLTLFIPTGTMRVLTSGTWSPLHAFDTLTLQAGEQATIETDEPTNAFVIVLTGAASSGE